MYKRCENCYKDGKLPSDESCKKCEESLKAQKKENGKLKQTLIYIKQLLEDALDPKKTNAEQSFDNFYKAIELCKVIKE